jgi:hypothetical protein
MSMAVKQEFAKLIEAQLSVWQTQIEEHQETLKHAGQKAQADTQKALQQLEAQAEQARQLLSQVKQANEAAWKDIQGANLKAFEQLQKGWGDALKRFV